MPVVTKVRVVSSVRDPWTSKFYQIICCLFHRFFLMNIQISSHDDSSGGKDKAKAAKKKGMCLLL
jgi:hypothetical protein